MTTQPDMEVVVEKIEQFGRERAKAQGVTFSEIDFLCGAGAALEALGLPFPPMWALCSMSGRPLLRDAEAEGQYRLWLEGNNAGVTEYRDLIRHARSAIDDCSRKIRELEEKLG